MAELKLKRGLASALALEDVEDGSLLFSTDTKKISFDVGNERLQVATGAGAQSDWNETNSSSDAYIKNKPTNVSAFTNDAGYLTSFTESDPTVPSWAKASTKPSYTASEVGAVATSGDTASNTVAFTSSDVTDGNASSWTSVTTLATGETHASLMAKMSKMFKNIRYLYSLVSTLDGETFIKL